MKNQLRRHVGTNFDAELPIFDEIGPSWTQEACPGRQRSSKNGARAAEERSRAPRGGRRMSTRRIPDAVPDAYPTQSSAECAGSAEAGGGKPPWSSDRFFDLRLAHRKGTADLIASRIPPSRFRKLDVKRSRGIEPRRR